MSDEQQNPTADAEVGADADVTNAAAADVEAALSNETLDDQGQDESGGDVEAPAAATAEDSADDADDAADDATADDEPTAASGEDEGPDVEQDEEGVAEVKEHSTRLLGSEEDEGAVPSEFRVPPGVPSGLQPGKAEDRDVLPKPKS